MDNIITVKYVVNMVGGMALMNAVGFTITEEKGKKWLSLPYHEGLTEKLEQEVKRLDETSELIAARIAQIEDLAKQPAKERRQCIGGCGFFGESQTYDYCSKCHQKKEAEAAAAAKASSATAPVASSTTTSTASSTPAPATPGVEVLPAAKPKLCSNGCGFYESAKFSGMCSVCYVKTGLKEKEDKEKKIKSWRRKFNRAYVKVNAVNRFRRGMVRRDVQVHKNRCWFCKTKVGITGIECRCGYIFCGKHRYTLSAACVEHIERKDGNMFLWISSFSRVTPSSFLVQSSSLLCCCVHCVAVSLFVSSYVRYPQEHVCPFDHQHLQRNKIRKENEVMKKDKFVKLDD